MMAGNPNWWSMNGMHPQFSQFVQYGSNNFSSDSSNPSSHHESDHHPHAQDYPVRSWSQLLLGGLSGNEEESRFGGSLFQQQKKLENWEDQVLNLNPTFSSRDCAVNLDHVKQEVSQANSCQLFSGHLDYDQFHANNSHTSNSNNWAHHQALPVSSPTSCITNLSNSLLNFSGGKGPVGPAERKNHRHNQEHSSECNSTGTGGVSKKARVQQSSSQPALKVRKEKLVDRITALHQIVSPFGKTDTATVLQEACGYIRFLQSQIEALSSPYLRNASGNSSHHCVSTLRKVRERDCLFHEEPGQESQSRGLKDLRSRGLCLVPISFTQHVGNDNIIGADYWAPPPPALGGGFSFSDQ